MLRGIRNSSVRCSEYAVTNNCAAFGERVLLNTSQPAKAQKTIETLTNAQRGQTGRILHLFRTCSRSCEVGRSGGSRNLLARSSNSGLALEDRANNARSSSKVAASEIVRNGPSKQWSTIAALGRVFHQLSRFRFG